MAADSDALADSIRTVNTALGGAGSQTPCTAHGYPSSVSTPRMRPAGKMQYHEGVPMLSGISWT